MQGGELIQALADNALPNAVTFFDVFMIVIINILLVAVIKFGFDGIEYITTKEKPTLNLEAFINYSSMIGLVERFLYIVGIWTLSFELVTIVIAVKTIMRFTTVNAAEKEVAANSKVSGNKVTAEKYILGTLLNLLFAMIIVWMFK